MRIKGFIRRGLESIEIALQNEGKFFKLSKSPFTDIIEVFYNFVLSNRDQQVFGGKTYSIRTSSINGNNTRSVSFFVGIGEVTINRYSLTFNGDPNTSDKATFWLDIPSFTTEDGEEGHGTESYDDGYPS